MAEVRISATKSNGLFAILRFTNAEVFPMTANQTRLTTEAAIRRTDPVYGWANQNRARPPHSCWDGRTNSASNDHTGLPDDDGGSEHFTPPSDSFLAAADSFPPPSEWTGE